MANIAKARFIHLGCKDENRLEKTDGTFQLCPACGHWHTIYASLCDICRLEARIQNLEDHLGTQHSS